MAYTCFVTRHRPPKAFFTHFFARASPEMVSDLPFWADFGGFWLIHTFGLSTIVVTRHTPRASDRNGTVIGVHQW